MEIILTRNVDLVLNIDSDNSASAEDVELAVAKILGDERKNWHLVAWRQ